MENILKFKGPFNIYNNDSYQNHLDELNKPPGIYIWGFMVDSKYNPLNCAKKQIFDSEKMYFLPYYVGKKEKRIIDRLNEHKNVRLNPNAIKYTRLSMQYLKTFFKDPDFPIKTSNSDITNKFIEIDKSGKNKKENGKQIEYYNNSKFLDYKIADSSIDKPKINTVKQTDNPITNFSTLNDTLKQIIIKNNNFWFCYAELKENIDLINCKLEDYEALTFYSLKGKTISKTKNIDKISKNIQISFENNKLENIFKCNDISINIIKEKYLNEKNEVEFPGY
ncbi:hypothetical protein [Flavobacterium sp.]|jgi:hypothetical protein|uniref:hypothetical protein n=1 Tax=Flavobacterium sp. TaxID=239 RepID=UPI0037BEFF1E